MDGFDLLKKGNFLTNKTFQYEINSYTRKNLLDFYVIHIFQNDIKLGEIEYVDAFIFNNKLRGINPTDEPSSKINSCESIISLKLNSEEIDDFGYIFN